MRPRNAGWRLALRIAAREAVRRKAQTALMLVLVCLPVLAVTAATVVSRTANVDNVERLDRRLGSADALVDWQRGSGTVQQAFDPWNGVTWSGPREGQDPTERVGRSNGGPAQIRAVLGERPISAISNHWGRVETDRGSTSASVWQLDLGDPLTDGLFSHSEGKRVPGPGEAVVNAALAERGPGVGERLTFTTEDKATVEFVVVGISEHADERSHPVAAVAPGTITSDNTPTQWLVGGGAVTWDQVLQFNERAAVVTSRSVVSEPPSESALSPDMRGAGPEVDDVTVTILVMVVVMVLIEVVLLAGPAFAVRARRQAHSLALLAAAGGTPTQARRVVLANGLVIGLAAGLLGVLGGVLVGWSVLPLVQRFDPMYFGPFEVPWGLVAMVAAFGLVSALLAAVVPAILASRQDVVAVLAGRRGDGAPSRRSPYVGLGLVGLAVLCAWIGATDRGLAPVLVGGSAILAVLGMIFLVPVLVTTVARLAVHFPLSMRFAVRDAARHRTRTVPAVAAVAATVAGVVALGIAVASQEAFNEAEYIPQGVIGTTLVSIPRPEDVPAVREAVTERLPHGRLLEVVGVKMDDYGEDGPTGWYDIGYVEGTEVLAVESTTYWGSPHLASDRVPDAVPMTDAARQQADAVLAAGGVVLLDNSSEVRSLEALTIRVDRHRDTLEGGGESVEQVGRAQLAALVVPAETEVTPAAAILPPALVTELGLEASQTTLVTGVDVDHDAEQDLNESLAEHGAWTYVERGYQPDPALLIVQLVLAVLGGFLMLGGTLTATFLALSDARPDLATMAAVGARPRTRRGVAASYAAVVGLVGSLLGAVIGFIPGIAISHPLTQNWETGTTTLEIPWLLIAGIVLVLPLLTAAVVALFARSRLPLVARID